MAKSIKDLISKFPEPRSTEYSVTTEGVGESQDSITAKNIHVPDEGTVKELLERRNDPELQDITLKEWLDIEHSISDHTISKRGPHDLPDYSLIFKTIEYTSTGLMFQLGKVLRPRNEDVVHAIRILIEEEALDEELLPDGILWSDLISESYFSFWKTYLYQILELLGVYVDQWNRWNYPYVPNPELPDYLHYRELKILASIWIIQCWDHMVNYGRRPRPHLNGIAPENFARRTHVLTLTCPFCNKRWDDVPPKTPVEDRFMRYILWLLKHAVEYHRWDIRTAKKIFLKKRSKK